jgi:xylulose-5-phosphate/fructose-6-phosphate phosphoketolase
MVAKEIDVPNPPPMPSHLPDSVLELAVNIDKKPLPEDVKKGLVDFQRAACYIAAGELLVPVLRWLLKKSLLTTSSQR